MQKLADDIAWHEEQIRLVREALVAADTPSNSIRKIEVAALSETLARFERTLQHLRELRSRRG